MLGDVLQDVGRQWAGDILKPNLHAFVGISSTGVQAPLGNR